MQTASQRAEKNRFSANPPPADVTPKERRPDRAKPIEEDVDTLRAAEVAHPNADKIVGDVRRVAVLAGDGLCHVSSSVA